MSDDAKDNIVDLVKERQKLEDNSIFKKHPSAIKPYTLIKNNIIQNSKMDPLARFIICYLMSLPSDWKLNYVHLASEMRVGRDKIRKLMNLLIDEGYLKKTACQLSDGTMDGHNYEYSDEPIFLENIRVTENQSLGEKCESDSTNNRVTGFTEVGADRQTVFKPLQITNINSSQDQDLKNNNNNKIPREEIVVVELKKLLDERERDCVNIQQLKNWLQAFGDERVRVCIGYVIKNAQRSPGGLLRRMLEQGWSVNSLESKKPIKNKEQEDMIRWTKEENERYWNNLPDQIKLKKYEGFLSRFYPLEFQMKGKNILDKDLTSHPVFDVIMELEGMDHRDRVWKTTS